MTLFVLDIGICVSRDLENGHGLAVVNGLRGMPHARLEFRRQPSLDSKQYYQGALYPMYAQEEYQLALHEMLRETFSVDRDRFGIDLAFTEDKPDERLALFQNKVGKAFRLVPNSWHYTLFAKLTCNGQYVAEWMMTDPLPLAVAVPDEYGR